jgi:hypothetical protein
MEKLIALSVVMLASYGAFAGQQINNDLVAPAPSAGYFRGNEMSVGVFGNYLDTYGENHQGIGNHALGGGLEASYFYFKCLGLSVDGDAFREMPGGNFGGTVTGNLILRLPLDDYLPNFHLAPYVFGGAGKFYSERVGLPSSTPGVQRYVERTGILADVGGGIEYRLNPNLGIFADARYNFAANLRNDFITTRVGIRYALPSFGQKSIDGETPPNKKIPIIETENAGEHQNWAIHFDAVEVIQGQPGFHSPYEGPQSLFPNDNFRQTSDVDLFFAFRVWPGGEIYFNPEIKRQKPIVFTGATPGEKLERPFFGTHAFAFSAKFGKKKEKNRYDDVNGKKLRSFEPIAFAVSTDQDNDTNSQREG